MKSLVKVQKLQAELNDILIERDVQVEGALAALISGSHVLFLGPPGTAKSLLTHLLCQAIDGAKYFSWLMTKFSTPEELFGPHSMKALKEGEYKRVTTKKVPEANIAFLDEALALNTPIATVSGWALIKDIRIGDYVFGANGHPVKVIGLTKTFRNNQCYKLTFLNGESIIADAGHNWLCRRSRSYYKTAFKVRTTQEMTKFEGQWQIPLPKPVELPDTDLPIDPYTLGQWLGNGNSWTGEIYVRKNLVKKTLAEFQKAYPEARNTGRVYGTNKNLLCISFANTGFRTALGDLKLVEKNKYSGTKKRIPKLYFRSSIQQRQRIIQGLMDTDGHFMKCGTCTFSNTNERIISGFIEILRTLGIRCSKKLTKDSRVGTQGRHKRCWKVNFRADPDFSPFLTRSVKIPKIKQRKHLTIVSIEEIDSVPTRCIKVDSPDHLFLAGRGMVVTHNCWKANSAILNTLLKVLNERTFENGQDTMDVPLVSCFGASNELPKGEELGALNDRFLLRYWVDYVQDRTRMQKLMKSVAVRTKKQTVTNKITMQDLTELREAAAKITLSDEVVETLDTLQVTLRNKGIKVSDRRILDCIPLLQAFALLRGESEVSSDDLELLGDMFWERTEQRKEILETVSPYANPLNLKAMEFEDAALESFKSWQLAKDNMEQAIQTNRILKDIIKSVNEELKDRPANKTKKLCAAKEKIEGMQREVIKALL
jgi:MoxR-like ATPase